MRKALLIVAIMAFCSTSHAVATCQETLNLKCGIALEGHIISQTLGKNVTFAVERVSTMVSTSCIEKYDIDTVKISSLNSNWKEWAEERNHLSKSTEFKEKVVLSTIRLIDSDAIRLNNREVWQKDSVKLKYLSSLFGNKSQQVCILEDGAYLRFVSLISTELQINVSDISSISYEERDKTAINGIVDIVEMKSGDVCKGLIIEKVLGDYIRIKTDNGMTQNILNKDIEAIKRVALNPKESVLRQSPYLDEINGTRGLIVYQKSGSPDPYIIMAIDNNLEKRFELKQVSVINSVLNKDYTPLHDIIIDKEEVYFNRIKASPIKRPEAKSDLYVFKGKDLENMVELNSENGYFDLTIEMADNDSNKSAILFPVTDIGKKKEVYAYAAKDVVDNPIVVKSEFVSSNGTLRKVYRVSRGCYALYVPKTKMNYFCEVK